MRVYCGLENFIIRDGLLRKFSAQVFRAGFPRKIPVQVCTHSVDKLPEVIPMGSVSSLPSGLAALSQSGGVLSAAAIQLSSTALESAAPQDVLSLIVRQPCAAAGGWDFWNSSTVIDPGGSNAGGGSRQSAVNGGFYKFARHARSAGGIGVTVDADGVGASAVCTAGEPDGNPEYICIGRRGRPAGAGRRGRPAGASDGAQSPCRPALHPNLGRPQILCFRRLTHLR
jgi:hypothetical protein